MTPTNAVRSVRSRREEDAPIPHPSNASATTEKRKRSASDESTAETGVKKVCKEEQIRTTAASALPRSVATRIFPDVTRLSAPSLLGTARPQPTTSHIASSSIDPSLAAPRAPVFPISSTRSPRTGLNPQATSQIKGRFYAGLIVRVAHHVTAQDESADPAKDGNFVQSRTAKICSKMRPQIVARVHPDDSCSTLPISSHKGRGLSMIPKEDLELYMPLRDAGAKISQNLTPHEPLTVAKMFAAGRRVPLKIGHSSSICLAHTTTIMYNESIQYVGFLSRQSTRSLLSEWKKVEEAAEERAWANEAQNFR